MKKDILAQIGNTPLVKLNTIPGEDCATIYAKCDFLNPTGSSKDRVAHHVISRAEEEGILSPGGTIIESTAGNTGLGLAMVAAVKGYKCICTMPDKMSQEKVNMLKSFGAEVVVTPTSAEFGAPDHYIEAAKNIQRETPNSYFVNQFQNIWNPEAHYFTTGPEVWSDTDGGQIDAFVASLGSGGTLSGVGRYFREQGNDKTKMIGVDPYGSLHYYRFNNLPDPQLSSYYVEGMGEEMECASMDFSVIDEIRRINDHEAFHMARRLVKEEGLFCGGSCGAAMHVGLQVAQELGPDAKIVVMLPDSGTRYISKYLSDEWMRSYGFFSDESSEISISTLLDNKQQELVTALADDTVGVVVSKMKDLGISQVPVVDSNKKPLAIVHELDLLRSLQNGDIGLDTKVHEIAAAIRGIVQQDASITELFKIFQNDQVAIVVDGESLVGVISKIDLIEHMVRVEKESDE